MTNTDRAPFGRLSDIATTEVERRIIAMFARNEGDAETLHEAFEVARAEAVASIPTVIVKVDKDPTPQDVERIRSALAAAPLAPTGYLPGMAFGTGGNDVSSWRIAQDMSVTTDLDYTRSEE
jgi:hypothetical protein